MVALALVIYDNTLATGLSQFHGWRDYDIRSGLPACERPYLISCEPAISKPLFVSAEFGERPCRILKYYQHGALTTSRGHLKASQRRRNCKASTGLRIRFLSVTQELAAVCSNAAHRIRYLRAGPQSPDGLPLSLPARGARARQIPTASGI